MKKIALLFIAPALMCLLAGCKINGKKDNSGGEEGSNSSESSMPIDTSYDVTVNFYTDYNNTYYKNRYHQTIVKNGSLITDVPKTPTAPSPDFPVFKGWSEKEITDDYANDIWNFSTDKVVKDINSPTLTLYGIWAAE